MTIDQFLVSIRDRETTIASLSRADCSGKSAVDQQGRESGGYATTGDGNFTPRAQWRGWTNTAPRAKMRAFSSTIGPRTDNSRDRNFETTNTLARHLQEDHGGTQKLAAVGSADTSCFRQVPDNREQGNAPAHRAPEIATNCEGARANVGGNMVV
ncbi:hypothetical protein E4U33_006680 [Claviceps sp. LM78 group G4]|nr:hypothetical protein E4U33_006680 [Claviceps sp. LM78 group G4]